MIYLSIEGLDLSVGEIIQIRTNNNDYEFKVIDERKDSLNRTIHDLIEVQS